MEWEFLEAHQKAFRVCIALAVLGTVLWVAGWVPAHMRLIDVLIHDLWAYFVIWAIFGYVDYSYSQIPYRGHDEPYETVHNRKMRMHDLREQQIQTDQELYDKAMARFQKERKRQDREFEERIKQQCHTTEAEIVQIVATVVRDNPRVKKAVQKQLNAPKIPRRRRLT